MDVSPETLKELIATFGTLITVFKQARDLVPSNNPKRDELTRALENAEQQIKLAQADAARKLGYEICRCEFPPQIMLRMGDDFVCKNCGRKESIHPPAPSLGPPTLTNQSRWRPS